jgi:hypothetical protein
VDGDKGFGVPGEGRFELAGAELEGFEINLGKDRQGVVEHDDVAGGDQSRPLAAPRDMTRVAGPLPDQHGKRIPLVRPIRCNNSRLRTEAWQASAKFGGKA